MAASVLGQPGAMAATAAPLPSAHRPAREPWKPTLKGDMATQTVLVIVQATIVLSQVQCGNAGAMRCADGAARKHACSAPRPDRTPRLQWHKAETLEAKLLPGCFFLLLCGMLAFMHTQPKVYWKHRHAFLPH